MEQTKKTKKKRKARTSVSLKVGMDKLEKGLDVRHQPDVVEFYHKWSFKMLKVIESKGIQEENKKEKSRNERKEEEEKEKKRKIKLTFSLH